MLYTLKKEKFKVLCDRANLNNYDLAKQIKTTDVNGVHPSYIEDKLKGKPCPEWFINCLCKIFKIKKSFICSKYTRPKDEF